MAKSKQDPPAPPAPPAPETPAPTLETAAKRRAAAAATAPNPGMVDSLLVERRGYVTRGQDDRVAQVDEQIRLYGGTPPAGE